MSRRQQRSNLRLYCSERCNDSRQIIRVFKENPELRQRFTVIIVDKYYRKYGRFPEGVRGTPTIHLELRNEIEVYEGDDVFSLISNLMKQMYGETEDDEVDYYDDRVREVTEDPGVDHVRYKGGTNRPETWGKGTSINTILEPDEWPEWAVDADGEYDDDPSIFLASETSSDPRYNAPKGQDLIKRMKEMENQRKAAEESYKQAIKRRRGGHGGRPPPPRRGRQQERPQQQEQRRGRGRGRDREIIV